jgi:predicted kinase
LTQQLILVRGLPGSGKSTLAQSLAAVHVEADMYFITEAGDYCFEPSKLGDAHLWCLTQTQRHLNAGNDVVVSNTFVQYWEMKPYLNLAEKLGVECRIICCVGNFDSLHNIDNQTQTRMKKKWQKCQWLNQEIHQPLATYK